MIVENVLNVRQKFLASVDVLRGALVALLLTSFGLTTFGLSAEPKADTQADTQVDIEEVEPGAKSRAVSIGGYSPVSYFTKGIAERGSADFAVTHDGRVYYLTSAEQVELYNKNPAKYRPRHESCSFSLANGQSRALDPTNFKVIGDTLLMFHKSPAADGLARWNASELTDEELLSRADNEVLTLRF